jgi:hypothetical protein
VVAEAATYTTGQTQDTNIHALSGIRTWNASNRAAVETLLLLLLLLLLFTATEFSLAVAVVLTLVTNKNKYM